MAGEHPRDTAKTRAGPKSSRVFAAGNGSGKRREKILLNSMGRTTVADVPVASFQSDGLSLGGDNLSFRKSYG